VTLALAIGAGALVAIGLAVGRLLSGPQEADRVVALDVTFAASVALTGAATLATGRALFLDIGVGLSLVGFVATMVWARLLAASAEEALVQAPAETAETAETAAAVDESKEEGA